MKTRKRIALILAAAMVLVFVSCAGAKTPPPDFNEDGLPYNSPEDFAGKVFVALDSPGAAEEYDAAAAEMADSNEDMERIEPIYTQTQSEVISTLKSGRGDYAMLFTPIAKYYASLDDTIGYTEMLPLPGFAGGFAEMYSISMVTSEADTALLSTLNKAIGALREDGTLSELFTNYIENLSVAATDAIPVIDGAETVKVGIAGDAPPFDYVDPAGNPAGFNVELMKAIAAHAGINVEFVAVNTNAKFAALESGRTDVHFYSTSMPSDAQPGYTQTEAYCGEISISMVYVK
jgi:ABC-type amino acid transport substrate-binding protein